jgi:hypothetical protein
MFLLEHWDAFVSFVTDEHSDQRGDEYEPPTLLRLRTMMENEDNIRLVQTQLALLSDAGSYLSCFTPHTHKFMFNSHLFPPYLTGSPLCSATYFLEGDYILAPFTYDTIVALNASLEARHWPTVDAFIARQPEDKRGDLRGAAENSFLPALQYFQARFIGTAVKEAKMAVEMELFKFARLAAPHQFLLHKGTLPSWEAVNAMPRAQRELFRSALPFLDKEHHIGLTSEMAGYAALATHFNPPPSQGMKKEQFMKELSDALLLFWKVYEARLPSWSWFAKKVFLVQPSSASVERVFSILKRVYTHDRASSLNDVIELSCMMAYNGREYL